MAQNRGKHWCNRRKHWCNVDPNKRVLTFGVFYVCAKFYIIIVILRRLDLFDKSTGNLLNVSGNLLAIYSAGFVDTLMYTRCSSD